MVDVIPNNQLFFCKHGLLSLDASIQLQSKMVDKRMVHLSTPHIEFFQMRLGIPVQFPASGKSEYVEVAACIGRSIYLASSYLICNKETQSEIAEGVAQYICIFGYLHSCSIISSNYTYMTPTSSAGMHSPQDSVGMVPFPKRQPELSGYIKICEAVIYKTETKKIVISHGTGLSVGAWKAPNEHSTR